MPSTTRQRIRRIATVWLGWTVIGLVYIVQDTVPRLYRGGAMRWKYVFVGWMVGVYVCAALTPAILWLSDRWPVERRATNALWHLCLSVVFSIVSSSLEVPFLLLLHVFPALPQPSLVAGVRIMLGFGLQGGIIRYWAVIALYSIYRSQQNAKAREREALELKVHAAELAQQLATAQLSSLKMQLHPHFLFNTLGAIMVLVRQQKTVQAETMVEKLGDLLRLSLDDVEAQEVPLWRELEFLRLYLAIEQVRFQDRLCVRITAPAALSDFLVPHMVLQPIVENAIRHALGQSEEAVTIEVAATSSSGSLQLVVSDNGPGLLAPKAGRPGIGLVNTRSRLARLYGESGHLVIAPASGRGVQVTITVPTRTAPTEVAQCN